jgi:hypothetical protein
VNNLLHTAWDNNPTANFNLRDYTFNKTTFRATSRLSSGGRYKFKPPDTLPDNETKGDVQAKANIVVDDSGGIGIWQVPIPDDYLDQSRRRQRGLITLGVDMRVKSIPGEDVMEDADSSS